ncbi:hypothetical protein KO561_03925 [Radiobacillus kanasensis]|uniref:hypothetical protein n=1 Tax=Radiobacillus kanasensis TaxID=2844358 RepID=UPI001E2E44A7|nr:hypothetical protein [Radiobacillus kanasensis]UFU00122.1 hypothetical protein KO561_03925 [Radiobacillus kanasensis]
MTSWTVWIAGISVVGLVYAIYSVFSKKTIGLYISAVVHFVLGVFLLFFIDFLIGICVLGLVILEIITGIMLKDSRIIRKTIHITNIMLLAGLLVVGFFAFFGLHFVPQQDPYIAEHIYIMLIYVIWAIGYYLQIKQSTLRNFIIILVIFLIIQALNFFFGYYVITFLEFFLE